MCGAPEQSQDLPPGTNLSKHVVIAGTVQSSDDDAAAGAFVRLLDSTGEFTAEVVSSASGDFRFFAGPGQWTVRALHQSGTGEATVSADGPGLYNVEVTVG